MAVALKRNTTSPKTVWKPMNSYKIMLRDSFNTVLPIFGQCYTAAFIIDDEFYVIFNKEEYGVSNYFPKEERNKPKISVTFNRRNGEYCDFVEKHPLTKEFPPEYGASTYEYNGAMVYKLVEAILARGGSMIPPREIHPFDINDHGYG